LLSTILQLQKHHVPVVVEDGWIFMVGDVYRAPSGERPTLIFGDRDFAAESGSRRDLQLVASGERTFAYAEDAGYLHTHRIAFPGPPPIVTGTRGDPSVLVDGTRPPEGSAWDSALTMVLESPSSTITLATPPGNEAVGMFLSVDGSDRYTIRCVDHPTLVWSVGVVRSVDGPPGMRTRSFFAEDLATCRQVQVSASDGDGAYSIGEIGFLRK
jgi:hypothetical protein